MSNRSTKVRVIALTQFVFLALGTMGLLIMTKMHVPDSGTDHELRQFLSRRGLWMLAVPIVWAVLAEVVQQVMPGGKALRVVEGLGVLIAVGIVGIYGWLIVSF